jgi:integrase
MTKDPYWQGVYREYSFIPGGGRRLVRRSVRLGLVRDTNKREAEKLLVEILANYNSRQYRPRLLITFKDFIEQRYAKFLETLKESTQEMYWIELRKHILPALGDYYVQDIELEDLQELINRKAESTLAWNSVRILKVILSSVYQYAVKSGVVKTNLVRDVSLPRRPRRKRQILPSPEQIEVLLKELPLMERVMVWLMCITGLRVGELLALKWSSIDWEQKSIDVEQT